MAIFIHRAYPGEHDTFSPDCWCQPIRCEADDPRSSAEIIEDAKPLLN